MSLNIKSKTFNNFFAQSVPNLSYAYDGARDTTAKLVARSRYPRLYRLINKQRELITQQYATLLDDNGIKANVIKYIGLEGVIADVVLNIRDIYPVLMSSDIGWRAIRTVVKLEVENNAGIQSKIVYFKFSVFSPRTHYALSTIDVNFQNSNRVDWELFRL